MPSAEQVRNLGLLGKEGDTQAVLGEEYMKSWAERDGNRQQEKR